MKEYTRIPMDDGIDIIQCNDCGAHSMRSEHDVRHRKTCKPTKKDSNDKVVDVHLD